MTHLSDELIDLVALGGTPGPNVHEHLAQCADCRAQIVRVQALRARLAALPRSVDPDGDAWLRIRDAIVTRRARRRTVMGSAIVALAAALLFAIVRVVRVTDSDPAAPAAMSELAELRGIVAPAVMDALAANLTVYDAALTELENHAASERENFDLQQRIDDLRRKRAALLRQASTS